MAAIRPRDLLSDGLLERLGGTSLAARTTAGGDTAAILSRDIGKLGAVGYLNVALPPEFGGLGCTLRQAACGQRRLARHAPLTALAVSAHLYWTGRRGGRLSRRRQLGALDPARSRPRRALRRRPRRRGRRGGR